MQFNDELAHIDTYQAGKPIEEIVRTLGLNEKDIIKLASNENPHGTSPSVIECIKANAHKVSLYPDDSMYALISRLQRHYGIKHEQCIIGSGSDQIIELCMHAKATKSSRVLMAGITFAMYGIYTKHIGAQVLRTPSRSHNLAEFYELFGRHKPDVVFLCVPNNPLGECIGAQEVYDFLAYVERESRGETLVVIDGAYQEFASYKDSSKHIEPSYLVDQFANTIYLGTFSKVYGLGGMRVGYGIAREEIIQALFTLRAPFNVTTLSLVAAQMALDDVGFVQYTLKENLTQMHRYEEFAESKGIDYVPSYANFITFVLKNTCDSTMICDALLRKGIIIRNLSSYGINAIRITIGTSEQNSKVLSALEEIAW